MQFCNFLKKIFANFRKFSPPSWGLRPRNPYEDGHTLEPRNFFLRTPLSGYYGNKDAQSNFLINICY